MSSKYLKQAALVPIFFALFMILNFQNCSPVAFTPANVMDQGPLFPNSVPAPTTGSSGGGDNPQNPTGPTIPITYGCSTSGTVGTGDYNLMNMSGAQLVLYEDTGNNTLNQVSLPAQNPTTFLSSVLAQKGIPINVSALKPNTTYVPLICPVDVNGNTLSNCSLSTTGASEEGQIPMYFVSMGQSDIAPTMKFTDNANLYTFTIGTDGTLNYDGSLVALYDNYGDPNCDISESPLMIHLAPRASNSLVVLSSPIDGVNFDIENDGLKPRISWPMSPNVDVFLALPNSNGEILSSQQLFGNNTVGPDGRKAANGFLALAKYAPKGATSLDSNTPIFSQLRVWSDLNRNGKVDPGELFTLADKNITSIQLTYQNMLEVDPWGNTTKERSLVSVSTGGYFSIFDVWFMTPAPGPAP